MEGFRIVEFKHIEKDLELYHKLGAKKGVWVGFDCANDFYNMKESGVTDWTGLPQSGKTELLLELLFNTSDFYDWKHLLYVPDIGDAIEVMAILIHKTTGKTFDKKYPNYIEIKEAFKACTWLMQHFFILEKTDPKAKLTPIQFWEYAIEFKKTHGIQTATIDSWKDMHHPYESYGGNYAKYLSEVLPIRNMISEQHNLHLHTVIHPKTPRRNKEGKLYHPQTDDMEGGAQWNNSGKTIISVHRETYDTTIADVQILKAKPKAVGKRGMFALNYNVAKSRYFETLINGNEMYAHKQNEGKIETHEQPKQIQPNLGFSDRVDEGNIAPF
jgi:hypothetical protein